MEEIRVTDYDITRGEKIHLGYFSALEAIFKQFCSGLESLLYDRFKISCDLSYVIQSGFSYGTFIKGLEQPLPMFLFHTEGLKGASIMAMENNLANLFLFRDDLFEKGRVVIPRSFQLNETNHMEVKDAATEIMQRFEESVSIIETSKVEVDKLVSHRIKAQIMEPEEPCVKVKVRAAYKEFSGHMEFCFSAYQLDPLLKRSGKKVLLNRFADEPSKENNPGWIASLIEDKANFQVKGIYGEVNVSQDQLQQALLSKEPIPLHSDINGNLIICINGQPQLSGQAGSSRGQLALQVNGKYQAVKEETKKKPVPFAKLQFPKA